MSPSHPQLYKYRVVVGGSATQVFLLTESTASHLALQLALRTCTYNLDAFPVIMEIGASLSLMSFVGALDVRYIIRSLRGALTQDRPMRQLDFDIDPNTGFFPSKPLPRLPHRFSVWEHAMTDAQGKVSLADDNSQQALAKREAGERWRESVRSVSAFSVCREE